MKAWSAPRGSCAVAMMSRSLHVSVIRRALPAISTRSAAGCARRCSTIWSPIASTADSRIRCAGPLARHAWRAPRRCSARPSGRALRSRAGAQPPPPRAGPRGWRCRAPRRSCAPSWAQARQLGEARQLAWELGAQLLGGRDVAGLDQRLDLLLERLADVAELGGATLPRELRRPRRASCGSSSAASR